jgi:hypothetical protein
MTLEDEISRTFDVNAVKAALNDLLNMLPSGPGLVGRDLSASDRRSLTKRVNELLEKLRTFQTALDPIRRPLNVLDPSDPFTVGQLIADTLLVQRRTPLAMVAAERFYGSGVYAIYYNGPFDAYSAVRGSETPLYIGKVDPKVPGAVLVEEQGTPLFHRLSNDHAKSIRAARNLDIADFECRYLIVKSAWQNTAEAYLIDRFKPIWNNQIKICYGFGKHGDSPDTRRNTRSPWDTLHPGRSWAWSEGNTANEKSAEEIKSQIVEHYLRHPAERPRS